MANSHFFFKILPYSSGTTLAAGCSDILDCDALLSRYEQSTPSIILRNYPCTPYDLHSTHLHTQRNFDQKQDVQAPPFSFYHRLHNARLDIGLRNALTPVEAHYTLALSRYTKTSLHQAVLLQ